MMSIGLLSAEGSCVKLHQRETDEGSAGLHFSPPPEPVPNNRNGAMPWLNCPPWAEGRGSRGQME
jgi:hypothetical protein